MYMHEYFFGSGLHIVVVKCLKLNKWSFDHDIKDIKKCEVIKNIKNVG